MRKDDAVKMEPDHCHACGYAVDMASVMDAEGPVHPVPGDITLCLKCGHVHVFNDHMKMETAPSEVLNDPDVQPLILRLQAGIHHLNKVKPGKA